MEIGYFAVGIGPTVEPEWVRTVATTAERLGFSTIWAPEHVVLLDQYASKYPYSRRLLGIFLVSRARARALRLKNPFNLNLLRGGDQRRQGHLAERNSDFWSFLRGSLG
jgi:hypothetical protein